MTDAGHHLSGHHAEGRYSPSRGWRSTPQRSADAVRAGWLAGTPVTVPLVESQPATTAEELDRLVAELAKPAVAAPVTLRTDKGSVKVPPAAIAKSLRFTADKAGKLTPSVDVKRLRDGPRRRA